MIGALFGWLGANIALGLAFLLRPIEPIEPPVAGEPSRTYCAICGGPMNDYPHIHEQDVIWPTTESGVVLLTDLEGGQLVVIPDGSDVPL